MTDILTPRDAKDVENAVQWALGESKALEIVGQGSKRAIGRPAQTDLSLDLSGLTGVTLYEAEELVLSARAGTPIAEIETLVAAHGQQMAFEPMDYGLLLGDPAGRGTIGGVVAANLAGPRRIKAGAARDHFLGFEAVSGRGEMFKSGGRVVKNVTGYDLCKLMAGSWGTLAALTAVTIKVLPRPETETTLFVYGLDDGAAIRAMAAAMGSPCDVSGAAHLPAAAAKAVPVGDGAALTALRLEGVAPSVAHRKAALQTVLQSHGELWSREGNVSRDFWRAIRDVAPFAARGADVDRPLWRISTAPKNGAALAHAIRAAGPADTIFDLAGGLIWVLLAHADDAGAALVRSAVKPCGGHATLIRAPAAVRAATEVFEPQEVAMAALTKRVKNSFDPKGVLNPGRMWTGI